MSGVQNQIGSWLFLILIDDLEINNINSKIWKNVDDTTTSEIITKGNESNSQSIVHRIVQWSLENQVQLNSDKCKELRISFAKDTPDFDPVFGNELEVVQNAKLLGVTSSHSLSWNAHFMNIVKKAAKRLYFLVQLERANLLRRDLMCYSTPHVLDLLLLTQ